MLRPLRTIFRPPTDLNPLLQQAVSIRQRSDVIALCPAPTGPHWLGIDRATHALFPECTVNLPQEFSNSLLTERQLKEFSVLLAEERFQHVILSGFPPYFELLARMLSQDTSVGCIFHGTLSELNATGKAHALLPFKLAQQGILHRIGLVRADLVQPLSEIFNVPCFPLSNICRVPSELPRKSWDDDRIQIGVLGGSTFNKNLHNQVAAALLVDNSMVHVSDAKAFSYLNHPDRTIGHGSGLSRTQFLGLLGGMHINLHISFSESFGQVAMESLALGVPCLVSPTTNVLDLDPKLRDLLTVNKLDSPADIAQSITDVLADRTARTELYMDYVERMNAHARTLLEGFLLPS